MLLPIQWHLQARHQLIIFFRTIQPHHKRDTDFHELTAVGDNGGLNVIVRSYSPDVECDPEDHFSDRGRCSAALDAILVNPQQAQFARNPTSTRRGLPQAVIPDGGSHFTEGKSSSIHQRCRLGSITSK